MSSKSRERARANLPLLLSASAALFIVAATAWFLASGSSPSPTARPVSSAEPEPVGAQEPLPVGLGEGAPPPTAIEIDVESAEALAQRPSYPWGSVRGRLLPPPGAMIPAELRVCARIARPWPRIRERVVELDDLGPERLAQIPEDLDDPTLAAATRTQPQPDGTFVLERVPLTGAWLQVEDEWLYTAAPLALRPERDEEMLVPLLAGARLVGRVLDGQDRPVAGAEVEIASPLDPWAVLDASFRHVALPDVASDEQGHFAAGPIPPDLPLLVRAERRPNEPGRAKVAPLLPGEERAVRIVLPAGAAVAGEVRDESDAPVAQAAVKIARAHLTMVDLESWRDDRQNTDGEGRFLFESLPPGSYRVTLAAEGYRPVHSEVLELAGGERREGVLLRAGRGLPVGGRVVDGAGEPVPLARVQAARPPSLISMSANLDREHRPKVAVSADGTFLLWGYDEGALRVWAEAEGFVPGHVDAVAGARDVLVPLERKTTLAGIAIRLDDAEPLVEYTLSFAPTGGLFALDKLLEMEERFGALRRPEHVEDPEGRFLVDDLAPGKYDLTLEAQGFARTELPNVVVKAGEGTSGIVFLVPEEAAVVGQVVSARDGRPVEGASVSSGRTDMLSRMSGLLLGATQQQNTDAEGRFRLGGLGSAPVALVVTHPTHATLGVPELTLRPGEAHDLGLLVLPAGAAVWGHVRDAQGTPQPGTGVLVSDNVGTTFKRTTSDPRGTYRVEGLPAGTYNVMRMDFQFDLTAESPTSYLETMVFRTVQLGENEEKRVDLSPQGTEGIRLEGTIHSAGTPEQGAMVWVIPERGGDGLRMASSDAQGRYEISGLESGSYLLQVIPSGDVGVGAGSQPVAPVVSLVTLDATPVQRHDVALPGGRLEGVVRDAENHDGIAGARVLLERTDEGRIRSRILAATGGRVGELFTADDGRFRFDHLASGSYTVVAGGTNFMGLGNSGWATRRVAGVVVSESRQGFTLEIDLPRGGAVSGVLSDEAGRPLAGVPVWARDDRTATWVSPLAESLSDASGRYTVGSLEPGPWTLAFGGTQQAFTLAGPRVVRRDHLADLDVTLRRGVEVFVELGSYEPGALTAKVFGPEGALPLHLASFDQLLGPGPPPGRIRLGRIRPGTYDLEVFDGLERILSKSVRVSAHDDPLVVTLDG